jgi:hypothetical protein
VPAPQIITGRKNSFRHLASIRGIFMKRRIGDHVDACASASIPGSSRSLRGHASAFANGLAMRITFKAVGARVAGGRAGGPVRGRCPGVVDKPSAPHRHHAYQLHVSRMSKAYPRFFIAARNVVTCRMEQVQTGHQVLRH